MPSPTFEDVLGTNYIPTDEEVLAIKNIISEPLSQVSKLDEEISASEKHVHNLRQTRAGLLGGIEGYRQLISPVRRLPPDVLREVFVSCLPEDRNPTMSADEAPVVLTRISSHWRTIALTTPRLWAALHIPVPNPSNVFSGSYDSQSGKRLTITEVTETRLAATTEWIKKSGTLPLSFSLHEHDAYPPTDYCQRFIQCILPYRARWKSIDMVCAGSSFLDIHGLPPSEVPLLQSLSLVLMRAQRSGAQIPWKDMPIFRAPAIRQLSLAGIPSELSQLPLPWPQLTSLDIKGESWSTLAVTSVNDIVATLEQCPNLVSCSLHIGSGGDTTQHTAFPTITLPHLESLTIYDGVHIAALFSALDAPKLRKLKYTGGRGSRRAPAPPQSALYHLLTNIGGSLEELIVTSQAFHGQDEVIASLLLCPGLKTLSIVSSELVPSISQNNDDPATFIDGFLDSLAHASETAPFVCPKLEAFECVCDVHFSDEALVRFIERRQGGQDGELSPLKAVAVLFRRRATMDVPSLVSQYVKAGMRLTLQYPPRIYRGPYSLWEGISFGSLYQRDPYLQRY